MKSLQLAAYLALATAPVAASAQQPEVAPSRSASPDVVAQPGAGIIPGVSGHTALAPLLYDLNAQPIEQFTPQIQRQYLHGTQSTFARWRIKKDTVVALHHHANEQITWLIEGEAEVASQGKKYFMKAGDVMVLPPNTPHEFKFTKDSIIADFFAPGRQDWMDGPVNYLPK